MEESVHIEKAVQKTYVILPAPHIVSRVTTKDLMLKVIIALIPLTIYSVYLFSWDALIRIVVAVSCTVLFEVGFRHFVYKDKRIKDRSAIVTGLLFALVLPPQIPLWMVVLGAFFAIVVGKEFFGGLGANIFNPALIGRAFLFVSFAVPMTTWSSPKRAIFDTLSSATPLALMSNVERGFSTFTEGVMAQTGLSSRLELYGHFLLGDHSGSMGESCALLIILSFIFLLVGKIIDWRAPVAMLATTALISLCAGIDPILTLFSGGLLFGAVFMVTDYATSPVTPKGKLLFGMGCGLITGILRLFAGIPEGVMFAILIMNAMVPFLDKLLPRKYGFIPKEKKKS